MHKMHKIVSQSMIIVLIDSIWYSIKKKKKKMYSLCVEYTVIGNVLWHGCPPPLWCIHRHWECLVIWLSTAFVVHTQALGMSCDMVGHSLCGAYTSIENVLWYGWPQPLWCIHIHWEYLVIWLATAFVVHTQALGMPCDMAGHSLCGAYTAIGNALWYGWPQPLWCIHRHWGCLVIWLATAFVVYTHALGIPCDMVGNSLCGSYTGIRNALWYGWTQPLWCMCRHWGCIVIWLAKVFVVHTQALGTCCEYIQLGAHALVRCAVNIYHLVPRP